MQNKHVLSRDVALTLNIIAGLYEVQDEVHLFLLPCINAYIGTGRKMLLPQHGYSSLNDTSYLIYEPSHKYDSTYHSLQGICPGTLTRRRNKPVKESTTYHCIHRLLRPKMPIHIPERLHNLERDER